MRRLLAVLAALLGGLALPAVAEAHPLGNFTVNRYAGIQVAGKDVFVRYALDLAEIPTYQLGAEVRRDGYAVRLAKDLELVLDGRRAQLRVVARRLTSRAGAGGLPILRLDVAYRARPTGSVLAFRDHAFSGRIGWREVTVSARDGARVLQASAPARSESDELRRYPADLLRSPLDVTGATATVSLGRRHALPPRLDAPPAPHLRSPARLEGLIESGHLSAGVVALALVLAAFWGAAHGLTPGHGKAMVAAYLVGTRGTPRQAFLLGGTVTVAHTAGVFGLGVVTLALSQLVVPESLYPWLTLVSGVLVVGVGIAVLRSRLRSSSGVHRHVHGHDHHDHGHDASPTARGILGVGLAAGLLPCPSALVVLLAAIALHRVGLGFALIVAFSLGLAATITGIGLLAVLARRAFGRLSLEGPLVRVLPALSAALILVVGLVLTARALPGVL